MADGISKVICATNDRGTHKAIIPQKRENAIITVYQMHIATNRPSLVAIDLSRFSWRSCASTESVAIGRASSRFSEIGSPVSSQ